MNTLKPELQANTQGRIKSILIRKDNGDGDANVNRNQSKKRVTFKQFVEYFPNDQDVHMDEFCQQFNDILLPGDDPSNKL